MTDSGSTLPRIGFIGLGAMGQPMAKRLLQAGYPLGVSIHRARAAAEELAQQGATIYESPQALGEYSDIIITVVPDAPDVEEVLLGSAGVVHSLHADAVCIDMSTISPVATRRIAETLRMHSIHMLDAPISGGPARATSGELAIMVGGDEPILQRCRPILEQLGSSITHVGSHGAGEVVKLCNNLAVSIIALANIEALAFGVANGLEPAVIREVMLQATSANYLLDAWLPQTIGTNDYSQGFATELLVKDLSAVMSTAHTANVPLFATALAHQLWIQQKSQTPRSDYTVLAELYAQAIGKPLHPLRNEDNTMV